MSKLTHVFSAVLGVDESAVVPEMSPENTPTWDSLNSIILLTEVENAFAVKFDYDQAMSIKTFADVISLVQSSGKDPYE